MSENTETKLSLKEQLEKARNSDRKYVILMETNGDEHESWYYFILLDGNEESLKHLEKQLNSVEWVIDEDAEYHTFDLELEHPVSELTAKEMTLVDLNHTSFHRKFDGKLQKINLGLKDKYSNEKKIKKVNAILREGGIDEFIDEEDIDDDGTLNDSSSEDEDTKASEDSSEEDSATEDTKERDKETTDVPLVIGKKKFVNTDKKVPGFAKGKIRHR